MQRPQGLPLGKRFIRRVRGLPGALEIAHHHGIEVAVETLDAFDIEVGQFPRTDRLVADLPRQLARR